MSAKVEIKRVPPEDVTIFEDGCFYKGTGGPNSCVAVFTRGHMTYLADGSFYSSDEEAHRYDTWEKLTAGTVITLTVGE